MRMILFLAVIVGVCVYAYFQIFGGKGPSVFPGTPLKTPAAASGAYVPAGASTPDSDVKASRLYRFLHREPPQASDLSIATSSSCIVTVDRFTRTVSVVGPPSGVDQVMSYLPQIDTPGGSCAVQAWAVYVDKSAQKGFDLVSAIGAVADTDSKVLVGNGGITFDINTDSLTAALEVICDGSVVEVIQRPHVHLEQAVVSRIESLQEVPIPSTSVSQGIAQTSVEYRKVGLQLEITPYFLGGERLRLGVQQSNGLLGRDVQIGENEVPIIETQTVSSSVEMSIGQTVVLGGVSTYRSKIAKGIFRNVTDISEGSLYVIISTSSSIPRAIPVDSPLGSVDTSSVPLAPDFQDPSEWISDQLLPTKGWQKQERQFIRQRPNR